MALTAEQLAHNLKHSDAWLGKALVALYDKQTATEKAMGATTEHNGVGFTGAHAEVGSSMAVFYKNKGYLTPKQMAFWRFVRPNGKMRIEMYSKQLIKIAEETEQKRKAEAFAKLQQELAEMGV